MKINIMLRTKCSSKLNEVLKDFEAIGFSLLEAYPEMGLIHGEIDENKLDDIKNHECVLVAEKEVIYRTCSK